MSTEDSNESHAVTQPNEALATGLLLGVPIVLTINVSGDSSKEIWYYIDIEHAGFRWRIAKKLIDVVKLAIRLKLHEKLNRISLTRGEPFSGDSEEMGPADIRNLVYLSSRSERSLKEKIKRDLVIYFNYILSFEEYRGHPTLLNFFELSGFSFKSELGSKGKEGFLKKLSTTCCVDCWNKRWFVLKDNFLMTLDEDKQYIDGVFLFDSQSSVKIQDGRTLKLTNSSFTLTMKCPNAMNTRDWKESIERNMGNVVAEFGGALGNSNGSFAPQRSSVAHWFVDGCDFFSAVADALESAKEEIFITGWQVGPDIFLKRRVSPGDNRWMLKFILERKAKQGVKIYVMLYDAPEMAMDLGEDYAKLTLEALSDNIKVQRHRGRLIAGDLLWSHHEKLVIIDQSIAFVSGLDLTFGRWDYHKHPLTDSDTKTPDSPDGDAAEDIPDSSALSRFFAPVWHGIDYCNLFIKSASTLDLPFVDHLDRDTTPRMPWHDVGAVTYDESARDVARHFIQRWNFTKAKRHRKDKTFDFLLPKVAPTEMERRLISVHPDAVKANIQVIRSATDWSAGLISTENSIQVAYVNAIQNAKHFIYIENQFFVSVAENKDIRNRIVSSLVERIQLAAGTKFRVYVIIPLIPAFEGDFSKDEANEQQQIIAYFQYISIIRGEGSLIRNLRRNGLTKEEIKEHVSFCALRTCSELKGESITEVLYVHSKMMVVDDTLSIIGSANINDRSMLGDRDSEVALCITDTEFVESVMNGEKYMAGKFSSNLRKRVFAEHLGMLPDDYDDEISEFAGSEKLNDIVSDEFYHGIWRQTAKTNTRLYDKAFKPMPANRVRRFSQVENYQAKVVEDKKKKKDILKGISGNLVKFPTKYLQDEDLRPDMFSTLNLVPFETFT